MQLREITATYGGKLNLGDYNSAHIELTATALLDADEDAEAASAALFALVKTQVRTQVRELLQKRGARVDEVFAGLPTDVRSTLE